MVPIGFGSSCGWYHPAAVGDRVVVLCNTIGFESLAMYRPLRLFAEALAHAGYGTLRFDYPGTGDAIGHESEPHRLDDWIDSVSEAVAWVRREVAPKEVVLCGLQFGGLLATIAATRIGDIDRLVLMAPIVSGRSYIRSQKAMMALAAGLTASLADDGYLDAPAQRLHPTTVDAIAATDLSKLPTPPARAVLLLDTAGVDRKKFVATLVAQDVALTIGEFAGFDAAMRDAHLNEVPTSAFASVIEWLNQVPPGSGSLPVPAASASLTVDGATETRVMFNEGGAKLVGVLCSPANAKPRMGLIISNTGSNPHFGYGRFAVSLSRLLVRHGVATLRMDMAGAGDSVPAGADVRPHLFQGDRTAELRAAADLLDSRGIGPLAAAGICSGAFYSLTAALADERIQSVVLINQDVFVWGRTGVLMDLKNRFGQRRAPASVEEQGSVEPVGFTNLVHKRGLRSRIRRNLVTVTALLDRLGGRSFPMRAARTLSDRGVRALFVTGDNDAALDLLEAHFGEGAQRLKDLPGMTLKVVTGLDHTLGSYSSREMALPLIEDFLVGQLPRAPALAGVGPRVVVPVAG